MKAIFVDGANINVIPEISASRLDCFGFYKVLTQDVGESKELIAPPVVVVNTSIGGVLRKRYTSAGFEVVSTAAGINADDAEIIRRISALDSATVKEIILVSCDQDFVPILREKARQGIKIWWVCTTEGNRTSPVLKTNLESELNFVELMDYKEVLTRELIPPPKASIPTRALKIELQGAKDHAELIEILQWLNRHLKKYPNLRYKIEG